MISLVDVLLYWTLWVPYVLLLVVGLFVSRRAVSAYRLRRTSPLLLLTTGLVLLTVGSPSTWTSMYFLGANMYWCSLGSVLVALAGAGVLLASIQARTD